MNAILAKLLKLNRNKKPDEYNIGSNAVTISREKNDPPRKYSSYEFIVKDSSNLVKSDNDDHLFEIKIRDFENNEVFILKSLCEGLNLSKNHESIKLEPEMEIMIFDEDVIEIKIRRLSRNFTFKDLREKRGNLENIGNRYISDKSSIGSGLTASVVKARQISSPFGVFALKMFSILQEDDKNEIDITHNLLASKVEVGVLKKLSHPNIVRLIDDFDISTHFVVVLEMMACSLFELILRYENNILPQNVKVAANLQVLRGLHYLHKNQIAHNDMKCENVLVHDNGNGNYAFKICDLGSSSSDIVIDPKCAEFSENYKSPEVILFASRRGPSNFSRMKSDMWSFGVIVYVCLFGGYPFETDDEKLYCDGSEYQNNELLRNLLVADPESRFSSAEALDLMNGFDDVEAARDSQPLQKLIIPANFVTQRTVRRSLRLKLKRTTRVQPIVTRRAAPTTRKRKPQKRNRSAQANKENKKPCTAKKAPKNMKKIM